MFYAGIGSRQTPREVQGVMYHVARYLEQHDWILRSGGAVGADKAFEMGISDPTNKQIFLASDITSNKYSNANIALKLVDIFHPCPQRLSTYAKYLLARDAYQVLGTNLVLEGNSLKFSNKSSLILCWTKNGEFIGGTSQAMRIAKWAGIPIINLGNSKTLEITLKALKENTLDEYLKDLI